MHVFFPLSPPHPSLLRVPVSMVLQNKIRVESRTRLPALARPGVTVHRRYPEPPCTRPGERPCSRTRPNVSVTAGRVQEFEQLWRSFNERVSHKAERRATSPLTAAINPAVEIIHDLWPPSPDPHLTT